MDHIVNNLWLGSQKDADGLIRHNPAGITAILNVRGPDAYQPPGRNQSALHSDKAYKWIPAPDTGHVSPTHVREALAWLEDRTAEQHHILLHCMFGISRSPAFLAAFMVKSGISANPDDARARILLRRRVQPAMEMSEPVRRVVLISALTGLPNRQAFDDKPASPFVAVLDVDLMNVFNDVYGRIAGDTLLRRLAKTLLGAGLDAYHSHEDEFLCRGNSREELSSMLVEANRAFQQQVQIYADGRIQTIEGASFSFGIGESVSQARAILRSAKATGARAESPEWLRQTVANAGHGQPW